jgi:trehalose-phosphatase
MTKSFWTHAGTWVKTWRAAPRVLSVLDFDGTLAPMVDHPSRARMNSAVRKSLEALTASGRVAVVSGRSLADVRKRVRVRKLFYSGDHGLEMAGPGFRYTNRAAFLLKRHTGELMRLAKKAMRGIPGVHLEKKGYGISVHYRRVRPARLGQFRKRLFALKQTTNALAFHWTRGHCVWELRPRARWDKGKALLKLWRRLGRPYVVAVGDDVTDEDMFRAVRGRGVGVKVGPGVTAAGYRLRSQNEVPRLLRRMIGPRATAGRGTFGAPAGKTARGRPTQ